MVVKMVVVVEVVVVVSPFHFSFQFLCSFFFCFWALRLAVKNLCPNTLVKFCFLPFGMEKLTERKWTELATVSPG